VTEFENLIQNAFASAQENMKNLASNQPLIRDIAHAAEAIVSAYEKGGCLFVAGNGGSAADAQHLVAELISRLFKNRDPIRAFALTVDTSILTAVGNDYGYELVFERQVRGLMRPNDVFLAITTSGNSPNILKALETCQKMGVTTVVLTGHDGGKTKGLTKHLLIANGKHTAQIQESHQVIYHTLCHLIEKGLVEKGLCHYV